MAKYSKEVCNKESLIKDFKERFPSKEVEYLIDKNVISIHSIRDFFIVNEIRLLKSKHTKWTMNYIAFEVSKNFDMSLRGIINVYKKYESFYKD